ncbi:PREDICTED: SID1 transmembrane family member 2 [Corvus brachyrhynchos]|uniref:SID1 transmembrane family member 2 n=1 Tax=Corvus brachyrhynchos TaxID=85066 RepID=UPI00081637BA|nr:PREDICTED: SID1 transmembrane family member 2 [Corvus brachyrhynchos]
MAFPCSVISIQDILCPVYDLDNNVAFIGMYQTMTKKAAITVQKKDFPSHSFYVVVVVKTEDEVCGGPLPYYPLSKGASPDEPVDQHNRQKTLEVMVSPAITSEAYVRSVLFCLGIFLSFYVLTLLIACWESCRQHKRKGLLAAMDSPNLDTASLLGHSRSIPDSFLNHGPYDSYGYGSFGNGSSSSTEGITDSLGSAEVSYNYVGQEQFKRRTPSTPMRPLSIAMGRCWYRAGSGQLGCSLLALGAPDPLSFQQYLCVADLARKDKRVLRKKYQIYFWNIATIAVFYALPVVQLVITYQTVVNVTGNQDICYYNFLCAHPLGNLSAFNNILSNLGYVLLGLLFRLIILQREINYNRALLRNDAHALECGIPKHFGLFYAMGTALMMEGLLSACYHVCPNYTNFQFDTSFIYMLYTACVRQCSGPMYVDRMVLLVMGNIINWSLAAYGLIVRPNDFASYLLAIGICNLLLYFAFYIIMKLRSGERIKLIPLLCIISTSVVWGFALFFFFQGLSTWQKTPAESREHNRDCILLDFFDDHDIWHFLSSIAMFGSFLVLLTLDDDLDCVQRDKIYVF